MPGEKLGPQTTLQIDSGESLGTTIGRSFRAIIDDPGTTPPQKAAAFFDIMQQSASNFEPGCACIATGITSPLNEERIAARAMTRIVAQETPNFLKQFPPEDELVSAVHASVGIVSALQLAGDQNLPEFPKLLKQIISRFNQEKQLLLLNDIFGTAEHAALPILTSDNTQQRPWEKDLYQKIQDMKQQLERSAKKGALDEKALRLATLASAMPESLRPTGIAQTGATVLHLLREKFKDEGCEAATRILTSAFANAADPTRGALADYVTDDGWLVYIKGLTANSLIPRKENLSFVLHELLQQVNQGNPAAKIWLKRLLDATTSITFHTENSGKERLDTQSALFTAVAKSSQFTSREKALVTRSHLFDNKGVVITEDLEDDMLLDIMEGRRQVSLTYDNGKMLIIVALTGDATGKVIGYRLDEPQKKPRKPALPSHNFFPTIPRYIRPRKPVIDFFETIPFIGKGNPAESADLQPQTNYTASPHFVDIVTLFDKSPVDVSQITIPDPAHNETVDPLFETRSKKIIQELDKIFGAELTAEQIATLKQDHQDVWPTIYGPRARRDRFFSVKGDLARLTPYSKTSPRVILRGARESSYKSDIAGEIYFGDLVVPFELDKEGLAAGPLTDLYLEGELSEGRLLQISNRLTIISEAALRKDEKRQAEHAAIAHERAKKQIADPNGRIIQEKLQTVERLAEERGYLVVTRDQETGEPTGEFFVNEEAIRRDLEADRFHVTIPMPRFGTGSKGKVIENPATGTRVFLPLGELPSVAAAKNADLFKVPLPSFRVYSLDPTTGLLIHTADGLLNTTFRSVRQPVDQLAS